jgi:hypothetical protein
VHHIPSPVGLDPNPWHPGHGGHNEQCLQARRRSQPCCRSKSRESFTQSKKHATVLFVVFLLRLEPDEVHVLVRLGRSGVVVADVPGGVSPRDPHVPQHARGLGDLPLAVVGHEADLGVLVPAVVVRADLPPEVHRADLPLLLFVLVLGLL